MLEEAKHEQHELAFRVKKNIKLNFRSQPKKLLKEAVLICIQLLTNFQNTVGKKKLMKMTMVRSVGFEV